MLRLDDAFVRPADVLSRTGYSDTIVTGECHMGGFRFEESGPLVENVTQVIK